LRAVQLDAYGNVLLAAKLIYSHFETREHWGLIAQLADFLAEHWEEPDHGLWEEQGQHQYTSSKVIAACGLEYIAEFAQTDVSAALFPVWGYVAPDTPEMLATLKV
jgi:alpha,alpha-trehalase